MGVLAFEFLKSACRGFAKLTGEHIHRERDRVFILSIYILTHSLIVLLVDQKE